MVEVVTVRVVEAATPEGLTVAGEKMQAAPEGKPEQLNVTAAWKPLTGATATVAVPLCPAMTVSEAGASDTEKSAGRVIV